MQKTVLITGASRGIGLGMVKQFLSDESYFVIACARNPSASLETLKENFAGRLAVEKLDVSCKSDFAQLADKYDSLDVVIANAGISNKNHPVDPLLTCSVEDMMATFETNCVGTLLTMQSFTNALIKSKSKVKVFTCISSRLASIGQNTFGGYTSYRASKAALNQLVKTYDNDKSVRANGIVSVCIHPGWVQTDMGKLSLTYSLTHSPTHSLTPSLTHSLTHSFIHSFI
jgi:NAD(P)-dependent dehydrogenase (short-subunit alcohol dehydrogenase family)